MQLSLIHRRISLICFVYLFFISLLSSQVVYTDPFFPSENDNVKIFFNADEGNGALDGFTGTVYAHTGVITTASNSDTDWRHVIGDWGTDDARVKMTKVATNRYQLDINIRSFYNVPMNEEVLKLAFVFRNQDGSIVGRATDGSDIFYDLYPASNELRARFLKPSANQVITLGESIEIFAAASKNGDLELYDNNMLLNNGSGNFLTYTLTATSSGVHEVKFIVSSGGEGDTITFIYIVPTMIAPQDPPAGTKLGINYSSSSSVVLRLHAPNKANVFVLGDFNNWTADDSYQMIPSIDGDDYWLTINGLTAGETYTFQYLVDGEIKIADPYSTLVLDPSNDRFILSTIYPNLPAYPIGKTSGIVSVIEPGKTPFNWQTSNYTRPEKRDLVVYELLMRDFLSSHSYADLLDTLSYLEKLGVNAIELMPVNEFEGNDSWGYNPSFHMALDKYYGDEATFKTFIDEAHARGIMVILDVVYNHAFSQSPFAQLYWDATNFRPTLNNPWLNVTARHPFNVGYDINHESQATKDFLDRVMVYWLEEFKIDGFRFDLSKGFTQKNTGSDVGAWSNYDASRISILKRIADVVWATDPDAYVILEHFAANNEEKELADYGMMLWNNMNYEYNEASMGYDSRLSNVYHGSRGWSNPHLVSYMESHDEERLMYKNLQFGASAGSYSVKDITTALNRQELVSTFFYTIPGPKMLWEFGELGYELSINRCTDGSNNSNCRLSPKPPRWNYLQENNRNRLFNVTKSLIELRESYSAFRDGTVTLDVNDSGSNNGQVKTMQLDNDTERATVIGNFNVIAESTEGEIFSHLGTWYNYFTGDSITVTDQSMTIDLAPGEYHIFTNTKLPEPTGGYVDVVTSTLNPQAVSYGLDISVYPNPATSDFMVRIESGIPGKAVIAIVDVLGRQVGTTMPANVNLGTQVIQWSAANLSAGVYWLQLKMKDAVVVEKIIIR